MISLVLIVFSLINIPLAIGWFNQDWFEEWKKSIEYLCAFDFVFCVSMFIILIIFPETVVYLHKEIW